jgi:dihydroneopterin aldolase
MNIHIEDLKFQTIIGILDFERVTPQDVIINLEISYNYTDQFINYVDVVECIKNEMQINKFLLLEDALSSISKTLQNKFLKINTLNLKITKPSILPNCRVSLSEIYIFDS